MDKYRVLLYVQVVVEANSPQEAEKYAFKNGQELIKNPGARVTASMYATKEYKS